VSKVDPPDPFIYLFLKKDKYNKNKNPKRPKVPSPRLFNPLSLSLSLPQSLSSLSLSALYLLANAVTHLSHRATPPRHHSFLSLHSVSLGHSSVLVVSRASSLLGFCFLYFKTKSIDGFTGMFFLNLDLVIFQNQNRML
jgi:hypothetical protein